MSGAIVGASKNETLRVFLLLFGVKIIGLLIDPTIRLFFGDSGGYFATALLGWIPSDRSFLYGYIIRYTALAAHDLHALVVFQSLLGAGVACFLFRILRDSFCAGRVTALLFALALALEPAQLFYERMLMAECVGTTAYACMLYAGFAFLRKPHWAWPLLWAVAGILAVSMRMSLLPMVLGFAVLPVLVAMTTAQSWQKAWRVGAYFVVATAATVAVHGGYKHLSGRVGQFKADYIKDNGLFRLGLIAPLVKREHVVGVGLPSDLLDRVGPKLSDPRAREAQIWSPDGLIPLVREASHDDPRVAKKLATYAIRDNPLGLVGLAWSTLRDYFDPREVGNRIADDVGYRPADDDLIEKLRECCNYDIRGFEKMKNPIARYFAESPPWLTSCYFGLIPLALLALIAQWSRARAPVLLLALCCIGQFLSTALFSHIVSFRYLHPIPLLVLLCLGAISAALVNRYGGRLRARKIRQ